MKKRTVTALCATVLLAACASTTRLSGDAASALRGQTVVETREPDAAFMFRTAGQGALAGLFGAIGAVAADQMAYEGGQKLAAQYKLAPPTAAISADLSQALQSRLGMRAAGAPLPVSRTDRTVEALADAARPRARYVLDVRTGFWSLENQITSSWYMHQAEARLIDTQSRQVVAQGSCRTPLPKSREETTPHEDLMRNNAALLRQQMQAASAACITTLRQSMLGL